MDAQLTWDEVWNKLEKDLFEDRQVKESERRRDAGMERAAEHAEDVDPGWNDKAFGHLKLFLETVFAAETFQGEDVRLCAQMRDLKAPPDKRAWGSVLVRAAREGLILKAGYGISKDPKSHRSPSTLWRRF